MFQETHSRELTMAAPGGIQLQSQHLGLRQEDGESKAILGHWRPRYGEGIYGYYCVVDGRILRNPHLSPFLLKRENDRKKATFNFLKQAVEGVRQATFWTPGRPPFAHI